MDLSREPHGGPSEGAENCENGVKAGTHDVSRIVAAHMDGRSLLEFSAFCDPSLGVGTQSIGLDEVRSIRILDHNRAASIQVVGNWYVETGSHLEALTFTWGCEPSIPC